MREVDSSETSVVWPAWCYSGEFYGLGKQGGCKKFSNENWWFVVVVVRNLEQLGSPSLDRGLWEPDLETINY